MAVMTHVPRPLLGLLVATVAFFALWIVALKPSSSSSSASPGLGKYQSAINAAKASVAAQNRAAAAANPTGAAVTTSPTAASGGATAAQPATAAAANAANPAKPTAAAKSTPAAAPAAAAKAATPTQRVNVVDRALKAHRVLALLFYNPAAADDQAVKQELRTIPTRRGRVVKLAIPISEVANYPVVSNQVPIQGSPTLVIIDRSAQAFTLVGFASGFEIAHRVNDALSMR
jgi:hypothetical protein